MAFDLFLSNYVFWCEFHLVSINKCFLKSRILVCTCTTKVCGIACITLRKHLWQRIWYLCVLQIFQMRLCKRFDSNMIVFHSLHVCHLFTENYDWPLASLRRDARRVQLWWSTSDQTFGCGLQKSDKLQHNMLSRCVDGTTISSTQSLMFQVLFFFFIISCKFCCKNGFNLFLYFFFINLQKYRVWSGLSL